MKNSGRRAKAEIEKTKLPTKRTEKANEGSIEQGRVGFQKTGSRCGLQQARTGSSQGRDGRIQNPALEDLVRQAKGGAIDSVCSC